jgi:hypothetical protein
MSSEFSFPSEIQERVKKGYVDRLLQRSQKMRKLCAERDWARLKLECAQLTQTAQSFGFSQIAEIARHVDQAIPKGPVSRATPCQEAREEAERLFSAIDTLVTTQRKGTIL